MAGEGRLPFMLGDGAKMSRVTVKECPQHGKITTRKNKKITTRVPFADIGPGAWDRKRAASAAAVRNG